MFNKVKGKLKNVDFESIDEMKREIAIALGLVVSKAPEDKMIVLKWVSSGMDSATFIFSPDGDKNDVKYVISAGERQIALIFRAKLGRVLYSKGLINERTRVKML